ncbi:MAG: hypothetical protein N2053_10315 [Chitinispirillaceae bacterium]|nr:hypothetical protein [Chitinispirillaceae bacterium]
MEREKRLYIYGFLAIITILWFVILVFDWSRLFLYSTTLNAAESLISKSLKLLLSFIVALFVWIKKSNLCINPKDITFLRITFLLFFIAEIFFYIKNPYIGIGIFSLAQLIFTIRNSSGIVIFFKSKSFHKEIPKIILITLVVFLVSIVILWKVLLPNSSNPLLTIMIVYGFFLSISTLVGLLTPVIGYFPSVNSTLIAIGSILFYIGDITVGLNLLLPLGIGYIISSSLTWVFYLPAIVIFSLSGYKWKES